MWIFLLILAILSLNASFAFRAPDEAPDLPDGWCDTRYGSPTRTTGECMCLSGNCEGAGCERGQGFVWYMYKKCPTCKCVPKNKSEVPPKPPAERQQPQQQQQQQQRHAAQNEEEAFNEAGLLFFILDTVELYSRHIFGLVVCVFILFVLFVHVNNSNTSSSSESQEPSSGCSSAERESGSSKDKNRTEESSEGGGASSTAGASFSKHEEPISVSADPRKKD